MAKKKELVHGKTWYQLYKENNYLTSINDNFLNDLSEKMLDFAYNCNGDESILLFLQSLGIKESKFNEWCHKHESLYEDYLQAKKVLAARRLSGGLRKKLDSNLVGRYLHTLDDKYKEEKIEEQRYSRTVVIERFGPKEKIVAITGQIDEDDEKLIGTIVGQNNGYEE